MWKREGEEGFFYYVWGQLPAAQEEAFCLAPAHIMTKYPAANANVLRRIGPLVYPSLPHFKKQM